jgi:hypothetical protein
VSDRPFIRTEEDFRTQEVVVHVSQQALMERTAKSVQEAIFRQIVEKCVADLWPQVIERLDLDALVAAVVLEVREELEQKVKDFIGGKR